MRREGKSMQLLESIENETGLYTIPEVALYARMPLSTLRYWTFGDNKAHGPLRRKVERIDGRFLTFLEFQEAIVVRYFRIELNIPLWKIREAIERAKKEYNIDYPFACKLHQIFWIGRDCHIFLPDERDPIQLTGKEGRQRSFRHIVAPYMKSFQFNKHNMPISYLAYQCKAKKTGQLVQIYMNPSFHFGEPIVGNTGYRAQTLWRANLAEGNIERTATHYGVSPDHIIAATRYCESLGMAA